ncbi:hypothetical protein PRUPE_8G158400 [Prunus persica]|uniref:MADS-box domain-containing protein n=1 Tax=Prunus persica TaxID=3760 RepID=A0A251N0P3_PRUPE|nr:hypothetical protein PRUPE_8G158400 [Prunus persica]
MENETNLQVTFSKRRAGLFKKASELSTLCGTELGLIVFSPGKKAFCFGHPSIEEVLDKYEGRPSRQPLNHDMQQIVEACSHTTLNELNAELTQVMERIEGERKRGEELTQLLKASQAECGLQGPVEELDLDTMEILRASLMQLRSKVADQAKQKLAAAKTANPPHNPNVYVGSSSSSAAAQSANPAQNNYFVGSSSSSAAAQSANPAHNNYFVGRSSSSAAAQSANPAHNNFFVGSSSSSAAAGPSGLQGLANPEINNVGFNFNGNDFVMQAPDQPNNFGFNFNGAEPVLQAPDQPNNLGFNFNGAGPVMQAPPDQPNNLGFNFNGPDHPNNLGFNFNGAESIMQAPPDQPNNVGFNGDPMFLSDWNPNLGGGFL